MGRKRITGAHWHVYHAVLGCLPFWSAGPICRRDDALKEAVQRKKQCRDDGDRVTGNAETGYEVRRPDTFIYTSSTYITVEPCTEPECLEDILAAWGK